MYTCVHIHIYIYIYIYTCVYTYISLYIYIISLSLSLIYIYIYIHISGRTQEIDPSLMEDGTSAQAVSSDVVHYNVVCISLWGVPSPPEQTPGNRVKNLKGRLAESTKQINKINKIILTIMLIVIILTILITLLCYATTCYAHACL